MPSSERIGSVFSRRSGIMRAGASTAGDNDTTLCVPPETEEMMVKINPIQASPGETEDAVDPHNQVSLGETEDAVDHFKRATLWMTRRFGSPP